MITITAFTDPWYAEKIASINVDSDEAIAILYGAAFIAQAIDNAFSEPKEGQRDNYVKEVADAIDGIQQAVKNLASAMRETE